MLEQIARDRASQLRRPRQARVSMRPAGEPLRWRRPCLGTSDGFRMTALPRMDGPARPRYLRDLCRTCAGAPSNAILADDVIHWPSGDCGEDPGTLSVP